MLLCERNLVCKQDEGGLYIEINNDKVYLDEYTKTHYVKREENKLKLMDSFKENRHVENTNGKSQLVEDYGKWKDVIQTYSDKIMFSPMTITINKNLAEIEKTKHLIYSFENDNVVFSRAWNTDQKYWNNQLFRPNNAAFVYARASWYREELDIYMSQLGINNNSGLEAVTALLNKDYLIPLKDLNKLKQKPDYDKELEALLNEKNKLLSKTRSDVKKKKDLINQREVKIQGTEVVENPNTKGSYYIHLKYENEWHSLAAQQGANGCLLDSPAASAFASLIPEKMVIFDKEKFNTSRNETVLLRQVYILPEQLDALKHEAIRISRGGRVKGSGKNQDLDSLVQKFNRAGDEYREEKDWNDNILKKYFMGPELVNSVSAVKAINGVDNIFVNFESGLSANISPLAKLCFGRDNIDNDLAYKLMKTMPYGVKTNLDKSGKLRVDRNTLNAWFARTAQQFTEKDWKKYGNYPILYFQKEAQYARDRDLVAMMDQVHRPNNALAQSVVDNTKKDDYELALLRMTRVLEKAWNKHPSYSGEEINKYVASKINSGDKMMLSSYLFVYGDYDSREDFISAVQAEQDRIHGRTQSAQPSK